MKKKTIKKKPAKRAVKPRQTKKAMATKPIGVVTHFYRKIKVAIIRFKKPVATGVTIAIRGNKTDFEHKIVSMQLDHKEIKKAPKGKQIGVKVGKRVREGDEIFEA